MDGLVLKKMRSAVNAGYLYLTLHANKELKADGLEFEDVAHCILTGEIIEQQSDLDHGEDKYVIYGDSRQGNEMAAVAKLGYNDAAIIITVYRLRIDDYDL